MSLFSKHKEENSLVLRQRLTIKPLFSGSVSYEVELWFMAASILSNISLMFLRSFISLQIPMCLYLSLRLSLAPAHAAAKPSAYHQAHASPEACTRLLSAWPMLTVCIFSDFHYMRLCRPSSSSQQLYFYTFVPFGMSVCQSTAFVIVTSKWTDCILETI